MKRNLFAIASFAALLAAALLLSAADAPAQSPNLPLQLSSYPLTQLPISSPPGAPRPVSARTEVFATTCSGRSCSWMTGVRDRTAARSTRFCSSRTLPGRGYRTSAAIAFYKAASTSPVPHLDWQATIDRGIQEAEKALSGAPAPIGKA